MEKLEPKFEQVIWLGVCSCTDEAIIGTSGGIVCAGTVKRQAIEEAWKSTTLLSVAVTPWKLRMAAARMVAWVATRCAHPSLLRGIANIVDGEFKTISKALRKVDRGSRRRRSDSRRPLYEQESESRALECERLCSVMRRGLHRRQPRQETVRRREPQ